MPYAPEVGFREIWRAAWPQALTFAGFLIGLLGIAQGIDGWALLLGSMLIDSVDGALTRKFNATSKLGARLDWNVDCALSHILPWVALDSASASVCSGFLLFWQTTCEHIGVRSSGRTFIWIGVLIHWTGVSL